MTMECSDSSDGEGDVDVLDEESKHLPTLEGDQIYLTNLYGLKHQHLSVGKFL